MLDFVGNYKNEILKEKNLPPVEIRIGIHTGEVIAGVVGKSKFQFDIWGDAVNVAARMESNSQAGKINISRATYDLIKENNTFNFIDRGDIDIKNRGKIEMFFVEKKS